MEILDAMPLSVEASLERTITRAYRLEFRIVALHVDVSLKESPGMLRSGIDIPAESQKLVGRRNVICRVGINNVRLNIENIVHPSQTRRNIVPDHIYLCLIRPQSRHVLMNHLVQNRPADKVKPLRSIQLPSHAVNIGQKRLLVEQTHLTIVQPHLLKLLISSIVANKSIDKILHIAGTATPSICPIAARIDRINTIIVVESQVEIPTRSNMELILLTVLIHISAPICIHVTRKFSCNKMFEERLNIKIFAITIHRIRIVACVNSRLHKVEIIPYVVLLLCGYFIISREFDGNRNSTIALEPTGFLVGISINLNKIATRNHRFLIVKFGHLHNGNSRLVNRNLVAQLVTALILTVQNNIYRLTPWRIDCTQSFVNLKSQTISHQGFVAIVVDERPFLCLSRTFLLRILKHMMALSVGKLNAQRLLWEIPRRISSATSRNGILLYASSAIISNRNIGRHLGHLVLRIRTGISMNADSRQIGYLIPTRVIASTLIAIKLKFCNVTSGIVWPNITHIAETS